MPGKKLVSENQWEILLTFMAKHPSIANGGPGGSQEWNKLAVRLNAGRDGIYKSANRWREYWTNAKYCVRRKIRDSVGSGKCVLNAKEQRILDIMGPVSMQSEDQSRPSAPVELKTEEGGDWSGATEESVKLSPQASVPNDPPSTSSPPPVFQNEEYREAPPWVLAFQQERLKLKQKKLDFEMQVAMQRQMETEHRTIVLERMASALERIANDVAVIRGQVDSSTF